MKRGHHTGCHEHVLRFMYEVFEFRRQSNLVHLIHLGPSCMIHLALGHGFSGEEFEQKCQHSFGSQILRKITIGYSN